MSSKRLPHTASASFRRASLHLLRSSRAVAGWGLLPLLLGLGSAVPARADLTVDATNSPYTISGPVSGPVTVISGGILNIVNGAQISGGDAGVDVEGGTASISGGSISGATFGVYVGSGGTASITGGTITGSDAVSVQGGTVYISGSATQITGSVSGVGVNGGTATISGGAISGASYGAALFGGGAVNMSGGSLTCSGRDGMGVYVDDGSTVTMSGGTVAAPGFVGRGV
jgi:hypothetical protein